MTENVQMALVGLLGTFGTAWIGYLTIKLNAIGKTGEKTHTLVNSNMGVQLRLNAVVTRRLADLTRSPEDEAMAEQSAKLLLEHEGKQEIVDSQEK